MVGGVSIQDLRKVKELVIPEGTERIGNYWFCDCAVESVVIPASVKEIGVDAFFKCRNLKKVTFMEGS